MIQDYGHGSPQKVPLDKKSEVFERDWKEHNQAKYVFV